MRISLVLVAATLGACSTGVQRDGSDALDRQADLRARQQADAAVRQARLLKEQEELKRLLDERKRRDQVPAAQVNPLAQTGIDGRALKDPAAALDIPADLLAQRSVYYDYDSYSVKAEYQPLLEAHASLLRARPDLQINVEGNCDERGSREYNLALGQRRAEVVKRSLVLLGASAQQISTVSFGSEKPKSGGSSEQDLAENRRSHLVYLGTAPAK